MKFPWWIEDLWLAWLLVIVGVPIIGWAINYEIDQQKAFMEACIKNKKEYECVAMWRSGNVSALIIPMPVVIRR